MTPEWYFEAGKSFANKFIILIREKEIALADTVEAVWKNHLKNLRELNLEEEARCLEEGFRSHRINM